MEEWQVTAHAWALPQGKSLVLCQGDCKGQMHVLHWLQGRRSKGAVSLKHRSNTASTAAAASPGPLQCGFIPTLSSARLLTQTWCCFWREKLPLMTSIR